jgi:hypothetical protein
VGHGGPLPPQPHVVAALEERLGTEIDEAHALLAQNQRLAATHVALVQEVAAARHELGRTAHALTSAQEESNLRLREVRTLSLTSFNGLNVSSFVCVANLGGSSLLKLKEQLKLCRSLESLCLFGVYTNLIFSQSCKFRANCSVYFDLFGTGDVNF